MTRYAVYALPGALGPDDAAEAVRLRDAAQAWYAREEFCDLTVDARRYGFHATLKAPFRLAEDRTEAELRTAADVFAADRAALVVPALEPRPFGPLRALVPQREEPAIDALAAAAVREFERFRAPPGEAEPGRRRAGQMTPRERELFRRWGSPHVLDEFRFHLTLTDPVPEERAAEVDAALAVHFAQTAGVDVALRAIALFVEPEPGAPFEILSVHPFSDPVPLATPVPQETA
ncbi:DUF1045 domain-containing protein [Aeromicrobium sp. CTD01-1L150]|uniref:DUF1045 domain-containing protein n=1 Tax=Aeromicrobium sp. CTD01-1L150 TaxID=3341830 RepID=UPI0035C0EDFE